MSYSQGNIIFTSLKSLPSPVITANNGLTKTLNNIQLGGLLIQNTFVTTNNFRFFLGDATKGVVDLNNGINFFGISGNGVASVNATGVKDVRIGNVLTNGVNFGLEIHVDQITQEIHFEDFNGGNPNPIKRILSTNTNAKTFIFGDINVLDNGLTCLLNYKPGQEKFQISNSTINGLTLDFDLLQFRIGNLMRLILSDVSGIAQLSLGANAGLFIDDINEISLIGNQAAKDIFIQVDHINDRIDISADAVYFGKKTIGQYKYQFAAPLAGAVTFNAANYLPITINGINYKIALCN